MTLIYKRSLPDDLVMPKMRTEVPYKTPSVRRPEGQYFSKTFWYPADEGFLSCSMEIHLVWFNRLGWYHSLTLETHWNNYIPPIRPCPPGRRIFEIDTGRKGEDHNRTWCDGSLLPLCAESADAEARYLITELRGLKMPVLAPYVLYDVVMDNYEAYLDENRKLNPPQEGAMSDTHYSNWTIALIGLLGHRLARTTNEVYEIPHGYQQIHSNACNQGWGSPFVSAHEGHLLGTRATCSSCQKLFDAALSKNPDVVHIMPDHHLTFCGLCTCDNENLKGCTNDEARAIAKNLGNLGPVTCPGCIAVISETKKLMAAAVAAVSTPRLLSQVIETNRTKRVDKKSRR